MKALLFHLDLSGALIGSTSESLLSHIDISPIFLCRYEVCPVC